MVTQLRLLGRALIPILMGASALAGPARSQSAPASAQTMDSAKTALIREIIAITNVTETTRRALRLGLDAQRIAQPQIPAAFWEEFSRRAERDIDQFIELVIPVYDRHFTLDELRQLAAFYRTPFGQRLAEKLPILTEESSRVGQEWGMRIGAEVGRDLMARGVIR